MPLYLREGDRRGELETFAKKLTVIIAFAAVMIILWLVRDILLLIFIAAVLAAGIAPAVHRVRVIWRRYFHRNLNRGAAVLLVYFPFLFLASLILVIIVPRLVNDTRELTAQMPALIDQNLLTPLERYFSMDAVRAELRKGIQVPRSTVFLYVRSALTAVAAVIAVLFMVVYMLIDARRLRNLILLIWPPEVRADRRRMLNRMAGRMSSWLSGQLILSAIIGVATFVALALMRIPYALPLAILAAVGELIPVIGPILGAVPALAIAILHSPWQFWSVLAFAVLLQKVENLFIAPRVMAKKVSMSPLTVIIAFMIGASLLGIIGAIMAIPVAAIVQVTFDEIFVARRERRQDVERSGTLLRNAR